MPAFISTGSLRLDFALGSGGIPSGNFIEITGSDSSGKTTLSHHIIAEAQKLGGVAAVIDADHTWVPSNAIRIGVELDRLIVATPNHSEEAFEILETLAKSASLMVIVLDSLNFLVPASEFTRNLGESQFTAIDSQLSKTLRTLSTIIRKSGTTIILTSQSSRTKNAVYHRLSKNTFRLAIKLHASTRLRLKPVGFIQSGNEIIGNKVQVKILKNVINPCLKLTELDIIFENGILKTGELMEFGSKYSIIRQIGTEYFFRDLHLGFDQQESELFLKLNKAVANEIESNIRRILFTS